jgi:cyclic-di-GMP-binding protein
VQLVDTAESLVAYRISRTLVSLTQNASNRKTNKNTIEELMPSFDIVSQLNMQEVENAINQSKKEFDGRYDLRGSQHELQWDKKEISLIANDEAKVSVMKDILQSKMHRRGISLDALNFEKVEPIGGRLMRQKVKLVQGIETEKAKEIAKRIRDSKLKVQAQIQGDTLKVTGKNRDDLQECMALVRGANFGIPLQFENLRS